MKKDAKKTFVRFLVEPNEDETNTILAFFYKENYTQKKDGRFLAYATIGQHSGCHINYANSLERATPTQYAQLVKELEAQGYNLEIETI